jgi:outer membrane protein TolC
LEDDLVMSRTTAHSLAVMLALGAPAFAQEAPPEPAPAPVEAAAAAEPAGPVLPLSLEEAVRRAMDNNVDIAVERFNPQDSEETLDQLRGYYEPVLTSNLSSTSRQTPGTNVFAGAENVDADTTVWNLGAFKQLATGGNVQVSFENSRFKTNSVNEAFNPAFNSTFNLQLVQPLLRNFRTDATRTQIRVARKNREISDLQFRATVVNTLAAVKQLYNNLIHANDNLEAQRKSLSLANRLLEENRIRVRVGTMAPLDVVSAESEVASREETVIVAEAAVEDAQDALKRAIFPENDPAMWATRIQPTDRPSAEPVQLDTAGAVRRAMEQRTDIGATRRNLESAGYSLEYAKNQKLPAVNAVATYGTTGTGGTFIERDNPFGGDILRTVPGGYSDAISDVFGNEYPTWSVGVNVSYPIFNRQADAALARARISRDQAQASLRRHELQIAAEVRSAARAVETNWKRVESTRAARVLAERRLDAETKKFAAGMSTNFLVTQAQRDLALAEVAELRAVADYRNSLVQFERVQEAGVSGGGGGLTVGLGSNSDPGRVQ